MKGKTMVSVARLLLGLFVAAPRVQAQLSANVILRLETLLTETPGGDAAAVGCKIDAFVSRCAANNVLGVAVELKRSDVNMDVANPQLGHLYYQSAQPNTAVYTAKGYDESYLFDLLAKLRAAGIKTYAWWATFNDAILAQAIPTHAQYTRVNFGSSNPSDLVASTQFVSPHSDVVRQHQLDMLDEILTHPNMAGWDGVRLDYIRFNFDEDDFSQPARDKYQSLYGFDPLAVVTSKFDQPWKDFRRDEITSFLQEATSLCHSLDPNLDVGGYLLPFAASQGGFNVFQGQGNDYTQYYPFNFRALPMVYFQQSGWVPSPAPSNFEAWTKERVFYSVQYTTDTPQVWPTFSITATDWCGTNESCHRQHIVDALLIAANSGKDVVAYGPRTVEFFYYGEWGKPEWDRLAHSLATANNIIATGTPAPTPLPDPNECTTFVPCGYAFYPGQDSPGNDLYSSVWRDIPRITIDCDADPACEGFNSNGYTKSVILDQGQWVQWTTDPCLGLYVKEAGTLAPSHAPTTAAPTTASPTQLPTSPPTNAPSHTPTRTPSSSPSASPSKRPTAQPTLPPTDSPSNPPTGSPSKPPVPETTANPTGTPTVPSVTPNPSKSPTSSPSLRPTQPPTLSPTNNCPYPLPEGYVFYPHLDSPGFDWGPFNWRNIPAIANDCNADPGCIAFNSNGWLKWKLKPVHQWDHWTDDACLGFYVKETAVP